MKQPLLTNPVRAIHDTAIQVNRAAHTHPKVIQILCFILGVLIIITTVMLRAKGVAKLSPRPNRTIAVTELTRLTESVQSLDSLEMVKAHDRKSDAIAVIKAGLKRNA